MKWRGREESSNIDDQRGQSSGGGFGGGSSPFGRGGGGFRIPTGGGGRSGGGGLGLLGVVIVLGIIWFATGQNPIEILTNGMNSSSSTPSSSQSVSSADQDDMRHFVGVVVKDTEDLWTEKFKAIGKTYTKPVIVLFSGQTSTACGEADAGTGPFYCPDDQKVYIDLAFYDQLRQQFGAPGDFAQGYVLAHEVGHHVQDLLGVLPEFNRKRQSMSQDEANAYSVRVELQADCYGGIWANYTKQEGWVENGDFDEAMTAANAIGDDTLQKEFQGQVVPRSFTHGTSEQRQKWFRAGYKSGNPASCDTFSGGI
ncbi:neutral zinc metallopeptidase [Devosia sp.]|uniref:KPN_02809 family neutral zinc metallopeptidase n=1 Tax=Devosia sp. TaxID=1871048 RepID=UPI003267CBAD